MKDLTTTKLIEELKKFPQNTPIANHISLLWNYYEEDINEDSNDLTLETMNKAHMVYIYEGNWDDGTVKNASGKVKQALEDLDKVIE